MLCQHSLVCAGTIIVQMLQPLHQCKVSLQSSNTALSLHICMYSHMPTDKFIPAYTSKLVSTSDVIRMGYSLALGGLPRALLCGKLRTVLDPLVQSCQVTSAGEAKFPEARRTALIGITR